MQGNRLLEDSEQIHPRLFHESFRRLRPSSIDCGRNSHLCLSVQSAIRDKRAEPLLGALHRILDEPVSQRAFIHLAGQSSRQLRHDINMLRHLIRREPLATMSK